MKAFEEAIAELIVSLCRDSHTSEQKKEVARIVQTWRNAHFKEFSIECEVSLRDEKHGGADLKAHYVRKACMNVAVAIAQHCAHGEESLDPEFRLSEGDFMKRLRLTFVAFRKLPWYRDGLESTDQWLSKLVSK